MHTRMIGGNIPLGHLEAKHNYTSFNKFQKDIIN